MACIRGTKHQPNHDAGGATRHVGRCSTLVVGNLFQDGAGAGHRNGWPAGLAGEAYKPGVCCMSLYNHALAMAQSRSTVAVEIPSVSAVSGMVIPPKKRHSTTWL